MYSVRIGWGVLLLSAVLFVLAFLADGVAYGDECAVVHPAMRTTAVVLTLAAAVAYVLACIAALAAVVTGAARAQRLLGFGCVVACIVAAYPALLAFAFALIGCDTS
jgi:hypothetical protein